MAASFSGLLCRSGLWLAKLMAWLSPHQYYPHQYCRAWSKRASARGEDIALAGAARLRLESPAFADTKQHNPRLQTSGQKQKAWAVLWAFELGRIFRRRRYPGPVLLLRPSCSDYGIPLFSARVREGQSAPV